jgi:membrane protein
MLGLLAVALVWNRVSPPERKASPLRREAVREAISAAPIAEADDRGRYGSSPSETPPKGWKDILLRVSKNVSKHRILALAAGMTYYSILAIFPAIAALVAMYGLFSDPTTIARHPDQLGGFLPEGAIDVAREQLTRVASKGSQTLGLTFLIGLATSLWSANAAMKSLFDTLNIVHGEEDSRSFIKLNSPSRSVAWCLSSRRSARSSPFPSFSTMWAYPRPEFCFSALADGLRCFLF